MRASPHNSRTTPAVPRIAGTRCTSATRNIATTAHSSLNEMHVFRLGVRELSGLECRNGGSSETKDEESPETVRTARRPGTADAHRGGQDRRRRRRPSPEEPREVDQETESEARGDRERLTARRSQAR